MRNEDFVRRGGKVQCTWKASLFCILMMQCVCTLAIATALGVFMCLRHHRAAASVLEHVLIFTVLARFWLHYSLEPCHAVLCCAGTGVETVPSWHGMAWLSMVQLRLH